jgi:cold shock protein
VLSVDSSTAASPGRRRSDFQSTTSNRPTSDTPVEETGIVKWFNVAKGYGFISGDSGGTDIFVHVSALERSGLIAVSEGQPVIVDVVDGRKGREATRVRLA